MKNILLVQDKEGKNYAIKSSDYFTCRQFDGDDLKTGESYQILNKDEVKVIGEIDENGEETIY